MPEFKEFRSRFLGLFFVSSLLSASAFAAPSLTCRETDNSVGSPDAEFYQIVSVEFHGELDQMMDSASSVRIVYQGSNPNPRSYDVVEVAEFPPLRDSTSRRQFDLIPHHTAGNGSDWREDPAPVMRIYIETRKRGEIVGSITFKGRSGASILSCE